MWLDDIRDFFIAALICLIIALVFGKIPGSGSAAAAPGLVSGCVGCIGFIGGTPQFALECGGGGPGGRNLQRMDLRGDE